jgi:hypothetical protein
LPAPFGFVLQQTSKTDRNFSPAGLSNRATSALSMLNPKEEGAMKETHDDVIREKKLPKVGDTVKSRKFGTLWRIIEKKEVWQSTVDETRLIPAIYLCFWKVAEGKQPGYGKMLGYAYTLHDNTFEVNWEKVKNS